MKKFRYIIFSVFLSSMIIYMGVGVPVVQAHCQRCADVEADGALLAVVEVSDNGCACDCTKLPQDSEKREAECSCRKVKPVGDASDAPCSSVKIQKLNLPILGSTLHLDDVVLPVISLIFDTYNINSDLFSSIGERGCYEDVSLHRKPPRGYLNLICTLLI